MKWIWLAAALLLHLDFSAQQALLQSGKLDHAGAVGLPESRAAACAPATALRDLEWNNIDALIETGGSLWQDRANGRSHYFAPKNGDVGVMFAGSLWLGGGIARSTTQISCSALSL